MTVQSNKRVIRHVGDGTTDEWEYDFYIPDADSLEVYVYDSESGLTTELSSGAYSVTGLGDADFGAVTYPLSGDPLESTQTIIIMRVVPYTQPNSIRNQSGFFAATVELGLDRLAYQIQQLAEEMTRTVRVPLSDGVDMELASAAARKGFLFGFNSLTGAPSLNSTTSVTLEAPNGALETPSLALLLRVPVNLLWFTSPCDDKSIDAGPGLAAAIARNERVYIPGFDGLEWYFNTKALSQVAGRRVVVEGDGITTVLRAKAAAVDSGGSGLVSHTILDVRDADSFTLAGVLIDGGVDELGSVTIDTEDAMSPVMVYEAKQARAEAVTITRTKQGLVPFPSAAATNAEALDALNCHPLYFRECTEGLFKDIRLQYPIWSEGPGMLSCGRAVVDGFSSHADSAADIHGSGGLSTPLNIYGPGTGSILVDRFNCRDHLGSAMNLGGAGNIMVKTPQIVGPTLIEVNIGGTDYDVRFGGGIDIADELRDSIFPSNPTCDTVQILGGSIFGASDIGILIGDGGAAAGTFPFKNVTVEGTRIVDTPLGVRLDGVDNYSIDADISDIRDYKLYNQETNTWGSALSGTAVHVQNARRGKVKGQFVAGASASYGGGSAVGQIALFLQRVSDIKTDYKSIDFPQVLNHTPGADAVDTGFDHTADFTLASPSGTTILLGSDGTHRVVKGKANITKDGVPYPVGSWTRNVSGALDPTQGKLLLAKSALQSIPNAVATKIVFPTVSEDTLGGWSTVNSQWTCPATAIYEMSVMAYLDAESGGGVEIDWYDQTTGYYMDRDVPSATGGAVFGNPIIRKCIAGTVYNWRITQGGASARDLAVNTVAYIRYVEPAA